ncbi:hypothetical protein SLA2020_286360 [Shorea laevis]
MVQDGLGQIEPIVTSIRKGIKYIVASEGRLLKFSEHAKNLQLSSKKLFLDVTTRWNSTYLMLATAAEFKEVFSHYGDSDGHFKWAPSHEDWIKVEAVCELWRSSIGLLKLYVGVIIQLPTYSFQKFG